ncbi:murein biosynthesis integral membrane protein MurJ [Thiocapsa imhoffii]|uniref:Probable lipid II flippase MurJ n=1 Tax=Thiocapsa imhoffii TaxID=382777 RepID=A0A9X1B9G5_9GAMM|nr:murein biosynthesis integral membrane protein MurJ [Thiocapsa imhoffii]
MASLAASLAKVGSNTALSRVLGFIRDLVIARLFGADAGTDAFFVAFKIPNFMRRLFAEGAFSMAFVPVLNEYKEQRGFAALKEFVDAMAGTLGAVLLVATVMGVLAAPLVILLFAPGFINDPAQLLLASDMLRLTFPYLLFISLTAFAGGILNTYERFGIPAFTPVLLNISLILCAIYLAPQMAQPIVALAWGVLIAGIAQLALQLPFLARLNLLPRPRLAPRDPGVRRTMRLMLPALFGASAGQLSLLLDTLLASFLVTGSISWLYYSDRLMEFPLGILAVALGTVILPRLSQRHAAADPGAFSNTLDWALRWVLLLGLPAAVGLMLLAGPLIVTLFHSGEFGAHDVVMARQSLMAYAIGLVAFMGIKVLVPGYYARQDMRAPVRIAMIALIVNLVCSLALMFTLGHAGLALATTVAAICNAALLLLGLLKEGVLKPRRGWTALILKGLAANLLMGAVIILGAGALSDWIAMGLGERIIRLLLLIVAAGAVYLWTLVILGVRPRHVRMSD